jgi:isoleucyl-tRNA synthetase
MIATLVFDDATQKKYDLGILPYPLPYKNCIVLGHVSDREGKKESKSKGNYTPPEIILDAVKMDFAVLSQDDAHKLTGKVLPAVETGWILLPKDDREGLDLPEPASGKPPVVVVALGPGGSRELNVRDAKALPRRVVVLAEEDREALGLSCTKTPDVKPVEVGRLPPAERVTVSDPSTSAPGADAFRWFFYASSPPWNATRHSLSNVRALQKEFLVKLRNVYSFFTIYANIDEFDPWGARGMEPVSLDRRVEDDRWLLGELRSTVAAVTQRLDAYDIYGATQVLGELVDGMSNYYLRGNRARFWRSGWDDNKAAAYQTLYEALVTTTKLIAPFVPFTAETMYQNLVRRRARRAAAEVPESVHLLSFPRAEESRFNEALQRKTNLMLSEKVKAVRELVSLGLQVRNEAKIKVRQPLRHAYGVVVDPTLLVGAAIDRLKHELNVLEFHPVGLSMAEQWVEFHVKPNFRALGQRGLGREAQRLKTVMAEMTSGMAAEIASQLLAGSSVTVEDVALTRADVDVELVAKEGFAAAGSRAGVIVLDAKLDAELEELGLLRELLSRLQAVRKEMGLEYADRVRLWLDVPEALARIVEKHGEELRSELLADAIAMGAGPEGSRTVPLEVDAFAGSVSLLRAGA